MSFSRNEKDFELCPPRADAMINSLRAFGYDLSMAIADLIDNSIFADATKIWINYGWNNGNPWISILDNGRGMSEERLYEAMRLGSTNPEEDRDHKDLGRFGLGLKTASFSQCKLLIVCSKTEGGATSVRYWDLAHVQKTKKWELGVHSSPNVQNFLDPIADLASGTIVVWQNLDRVIDLSEEGIKTAENSFYEKFVVVVQNIEMIFHKFLSDRRRHLSIRVGQHNCVPWDPFLRENEFTQILSKEIHEDGRITVVPFVLPHVSKRTGNQTSIGAGPKGWNAQQGFYVYRNKRMIISGGYLDFDLKPEEHYKLARIMLDITNDMDHEWNVDVRKAFASPPDRLRNDLLRIAKATRNEAVKIYRARTGRPRRIKHAESISDIWLKKRIGEKIVYRINRKNPVLSRLFEMVKAPESWIRKLTHAIETTVPHKLIILDNAELEDCHADIPPERVRPPEHMLALCEEFYKRETQNGKEPQAAIDFVISIDPFNTHPSYRTQLEKHLEKKE